MLMWFLIFNSYETKTSDEYFKIKGVVALQVLLPPSEVQRYNAFGIKCLVKILVFENEKIGF